MKSFFFLAVIINVSLIASTPTPGERIWNILSQTEQTAQISDSKLDEINLDFSSIYTALQAIDDRVALDASKLEHISVITVDPFIFTSAMISKLEMAESFIDPVESSLDTLDSCFGTGISQEDVGTTGFTISAPGRYYLTENITFSPLSGIPAITIDANRVLLDLEGFTITQGNSQTGVGGIEVISGHNNISIINGTIRNTSADGIFIDTVDNVYLANLYVLESGLLNSGMSIDGTDGIEFTGTCINGFLENIIVSASSDEGLDLAGCENFIVTNCQLISNKGSDGGSFISDGCAYMLFENCQWIQNSGAGAIIGLSSSLAFKSCQFVNNNTHGLNSNGMNSPNNVFKNCIFNGNRLNGMRLENIDRAVIKNCNISQNNDNGISIADADTDNNFIFRNTLLENGGNSIDESGGANNSYLGNYAYKTSGTNYNEGGSMINSTSVNVTSAFTTQPVFWRNIDATP